MASIRVPIRMNANVEWEFVTKGIRHTSCFSPTHASSTHLGGGFVRGYWIAAKGVVFVTLEDRAGSVSIIVWRSIRARLWAVAG
jgi:hypothetical protein